MNSEKSGYIICYNNRNSESEQRFDAVTRAQRNAVTLSLDLQACNMRITTWNHASSSEAAENVHTN